MARLKQYFYDLHIHTNRHSACSTIEPVEAVRAARRRGLDGIAFTEHSYIWSPEEIEEIRVRSGFPSFPVIAGCEVSTQSNGRQTGDLFVFGVEGIPETPCGIDEICRIAHQQGGVVIAAHPYVEMIGMGDEMRSARIDGIEVANYRYRNPTDTQRLEEICCDLQIAPIGSSDAHAVDEIGGFCVRLGEMAFTAQDLARIIRGRELRTLSEAPAWENTAIFVSLVSIGSNRVESLLVSAGSATLL